MINVDEKSTKNIKMKRMIEKKILEKRSKFEYDNVRRCQHKEFKCANIHDVSHQ